MIPKPIVYKVSTVYAPYLDFLKITIKQIWNIRGKEKKNYSILLSIEMTKKMMVSQVQVGSVDNAKCKKNGNNNHKQTTTTNQRVLSAWICMHASACIAYCVCVFASDYTALALNFNDVLRF